MTPAQLAIHTDGAVSSGTTLWRFRGRLQLTVVVKAVFSIVPEGVATPVGPGEVVGADRLVEGSPLGSVATASDLAPYLIRCDVLFSGHAHAPPGAPVTAGTARLGISRHGQWLLDKTIYVYGDRGPAGAPEPFQRMPIVYERAAGGRDAPNFTDPTGAPWPAGFGPISRHWPARRLVLGSLDPGSLELPIPILPDAMPWEYFQAAPPDQQIDLLRGGEWLALEGLHPARLRLHTRLPATRAAARVLLRRAGSSLAETDLELACDTLSIDGDRQTFSLTWRGGYEVPEGEGPASTLVILAGMETPGFPVDWARIEASPARGAAPPSPPAAPSPAPPLPSPSRKRPTLTMTAGPEQLAALARAAALPFKPSGASARPPSTDATPWGRPQAPPVVVATPAPVPEKIATVSLGLGMRLGSAPSGGIRVLLMNPPAVVPPTSEPRIEGDDDSERDTQSPSAPSPPPPRVFVPEPPGMVAMVARPSDLPPPPAILPLPPPDPWAREASLPPEREERDEPAQPAQAEHPPETSEPQPPAPKAPEPKPAVIMTRAEAWPRPAAPPTEAPPRPPPPPPPTTFDRPAAAAVKGSFYSKFARK